jgi:hypothetical protein
MLLGDLMSLYDLMEAKPKHNGLIQIVNEVRVRK